MPARQPGELSSITELLLGSTDPRQRQRLDKRLRGLCDDCLTSLSMQGCRSKSHCTSNTVAQQHKAIDRELPPQRREDDLGFFANEMGRGPAGLQLRFAETQAVVRNHRPRRRLRQGRRKVAPQLDAAQ